LYQIPVISTEAIRQQKAARYIHLLAAFLMLGNAWGVFNDNASPNLFFVVVQVAMSLMTISYVIGGKKLFPNELLSHRIFRCAEILMLTYASYCFYTYQHYHLMSFFEAVSTAGLCYLVISERYLFREQVILLDEEGIRLPAADNHKLISWTSVDNLRIRNDYVSVNTLANRFIQYETAHTYSEAELDSMNAWCFQHLPSTNDASNTQA
jgi:hypothetical protein